MGVKKWKPIPNQRDKIASMRALYSFLYGIKYFCIFKQEKNISPKNK